MEIKKLLSGPVVRKIFIVGKVFAGVLAGLAVIAFLKFSYVKISKGPVGKFCKDLACSTFLDQNKTGICRNKCGKKDKVAFWCDPAHYNENVPEDGMIAYVDQGGCEIAAAKCSPPQHCPQDALTCVAQCPPDPHRMVTQDGCQCEGNWSPDGPKCVCRYPFSIVEGGRCAAPQSKECSYDPEGNTFFACVAPSREVQIYWKGRRIYFCRGSCYSSLCVANNNLVLGDYLYFRGSFRDVIAAKRDIFHSYAPAMGGYYNLCRVPLK